MPAFPEPPATPACRRHRRRWILLACLLTLCMAFAWFAYPRLTLSPTPRPEYWEAKLAALDPSTPGAVPTDKAMILISALPWEGNPILAAVPNFRLYELLMNSWDPVNRPEIVAANQLFETSAFQDARRQILEMLQAGWREPVVELDLFSAQATGLMAYYELHRWLATHARWACEHRRDPGLAAEDWLASLRLGRQIHRRRTSDFLMWESRIIEAAAHEMMLAAKAGVILPDTAAFTRQADEIIGPSPAPHELLEAYRIAAYCFLEYLYVREGGDWLSVSETARLYVPYLTLASPPPATSRLWNLTSPLYHDLPEAIRRTDRCFEEMSKAVDLVTCRRIGTSIGADRSIQLSALDGTLSGPRGGGGLVSLDGLASRYRAVCSLDAGLTMLALEGYRKRHGQYPETLAELVPDHLPRLPIDHADRQPLRYRRTEKAYMLYSIGEDGKDDNGDASRWRPADFNYNTVDADVLFSAIRREEIR